MRENRLLISIHDRCQYRCQFCVYLQGTPSTKLTTAQWLWVLEQARAGGFQTLEIGGRGEPTLNPDFGRIVNKAHGLGYTIELLTNAQNYRAMRGALPKINSVTINLNTVDERDFKRIHNPRPGISFQQGVENIGKVIRYISENNLKVALKINYVISLQSILAAPEFPERVNKLFADQLGRRRKIYIFFQHMHNYLGAPADSGLDKGRLNKFLLFFQAFGKNEYLWRYSNVSEFLGKTRNMIEHLDMRKVKPGRGRVNKAGKADYICDVYKKVLFVDNNGDLYGCFNPFRVANGLSLAEDPFYWGNVMNQDFGQIVSRQKDPGPTIDVTKPYWRACLSCKIEKIALPSRDFSKRSPSGSVL